jgi:protein-S-isoprenylcysteine O-methyltransferase Ste14
MRHDQAASGDKATEARKPSQLSNQIHAHGQTTLICLYAAVHFWRPDPLLFASGLGQAIGSIFCTVGILVIALAFIPLRHVIQIAPRPREGGMLITNGIYRYLRHPIYFGIVLSVIGLWLKSPRLSTAISGLAVIAWLALKVKVEERFLLATYPGYAQYRSTTWGLFPAWRRKGIGQGGSTAA